MLRIAICDDQAHILQELTRQIRAAFERRSIPVQLLSLDSAGALYSAMADAPLDALFLDIDLGTVDGITIGRRLHKQEDAPALIYVSSHAERVFESFAAAPLRFIQKERFSLEVDDAVEAILQYLKRRDRQRLVLNGRSGILSIPVDDILYIECFAKVQQIVTACQSYEIRCTLSELEERLGELGFLRPHKGYLVNYRCVECIESDRLCLRNGQSIPVSKHKLSQIKQQYLCLITRDLDIYIPSPTGKRKDG